jgi:hypothetical protein
MSAVALRGMMIAVVLAGALAACTQAMKDDGQCEPGVSDISKIGSTLPNPNC